MVYTDVEDVKRVVDVFVFLTAKAHPLCADHELAGPADLSLF
jgi:hypothetical protein